MNCEVKNFFPLCMSIKIWEFFSRADANFPSVGESNRKIVVLRLFGRLDRFPVENWPIADIAIAFASRTSQRL